MDIERLRQAVIDKKFILSANPDWRAGRSCGLSDDEAEQKTNDALTIILESTAELVVAYLIDARQSATSEDVAEAIEVIKDIQQEYIKQDHTRDDVLRYESLSLAITALQQYQPWIPVSERLPAKEDANKKGDVLCRFSDGAVETWPWNEITEWNNNSLRVDEGFDGITHWRPMLPEPPKGE